MKRLPRYTPLVLAHQFNPSHVHNNWLFSLISIQFFTTMRHFLTRAGLSLILTSALFYNKGPINRANVVFAALLFPLVS